MKYLLVFKKKMKFCLQKFEVKLTMMISERCNTYI